MQHLLTLSLVMTRSLPAYSTSREPSEALDMRGAISQMEKRWPLIFAQL